MKRTLFSTQIHKVCAYALCFVLAVSFWGCSTPVKQYTVEQLLPKQHLGTLSTNLPQSLLDSYLYKGFADKWDSVLIVKPYSVTSSVRSIKIGNYSSISNIVHNQSLSDVTCTLLFVKAGQYVGYSLFPRTLDLVTVSKGKPDQLVWLNKKDFDNLTIKKTSSLEPRYSIALNLPSKP